VRLDPESVQAVALAVVDLLRGEREAPAQAYLTPAEVALRFGVSRAWVYPHASELGAVRMGIGRKPRLRFDAKHVELALAANSARDGATRERVRRVAADQDFEATLGVLPDAWRRAALR
jgi:hypothetical protein